ESVSISGRPTRGVHLMDVKDGDSVVSLARIQNLPERQVSAREGAVDGDAEDEAELEELLEEDMEMDDLPDEDEEMDDPPED
ncbi:MAG: hypothetical protein RBT34_05140, partial [Anaerolineaceae bacterium]|nr:hypothetical protein [Anaerolineaceae bacterium]